MPGWPVMLFKRAGHTVDDLGFGGGGVHHPLPSCF
ncbi:MAG: hypothetical protein ACJAVV_003879 [Alphaproteobacteria bacterium]|jgi:hypothetical protein